MTATLDHLLIPARDRRAAAELIAGLLGVPWSTQSAFGPFSQVFLNEHCTIDFDEWTDPIPKGHYCFKVTEVEFAQVLARLQERNLPFRSTPHGPVDRQVNPVFGGRLVYWDQPDGHVWEVLTVSYERSPGKKEPVNESADARIEALKRFYAAINRNDMDAITRDFDAGIVRVEPEGFPTAGTYRGIEQVQAHVRTGRGTWAEGTCDPEEFLVNGDKVVVYLHAWVRLKGASEWTGGRFADGFVFRGGRIVEYLSFGERGDALAWAGIEAPKPG